MSNERVGASGKLYYEDQQPIREFLLYKVKDGKFIEVFVSKH